MDTTRLHVYVPADILAEIDARRGGLSRGRLLLEAVRAGLGLPSVLTAPVAATVTAAGTTDDGDVCRRA